MSPKARRWVAAEVIGGPRDGETVPIMSHWGQVVFDPEGTPISARYARDGDSEPYVHEIQNRQHVLRHD